MFTPKPEWLKIKFQDTKEKDEVMKTLSSLSLNTVCEEAECPNLTECFGKKTATFMILGNICTRHCTFCNVNRGKPGEIDIKEAENITEAVKTLGLKHVVITSVTRDDLTDGGAGHFGNVITNIRQVNKNIMIEVLIPDFCGNEDSLKIITTAKPDIINHNIETVPGLYNEVRPDAIYKRSIQLLKNVKKINKKIKTKSGIMIGLGEKEDEIINVFKELRDADCDFLTIGQYLSPSKKHHPVIEYIHPDVFKKIKRIAMELGFKYVESDPFVRSSYNAKKFLGN